MSKPNSTFCVVPWKAVRENSFSSELDMPLTQKLSLLPLPALPLPPPASTGAAAR
ncbi:hypothetical protein D3C83_111470 [compost metagenome]